MGTMPWERGGAGCGRGVWARGGKGPLRRGRGTAARGRNASALNEQPYEPYHHALACVLLLRTVKRSGGLFRTHQPSNLGPTQGAWGGPPVF